MYCTFLENFHMHPSGVDTGEIDQWQRMSSVRIFSEIIGHLLLRKSPQFLNGSVAQRRSNYHTTNEGLVRIPYKCLFQIYVLPKMKLRGLVISKTEL
jgi:hypothetical protein